MPTTAGPGPAASSFSLPLASWQQPRSQRALHYERRKRKHSDGHRQRDSDDHSEGDGGGDGYGSGGSESRPDDLTSAYSSARASSAHTLTPDEHRQYLVAGLSLDSKLPGGDFPHASPSKAGRRVQRTRRQAQREISSLSQPVYHHGTQSIQTLRYRHLAVVTTMLHRCLMDGDYVRAGRIWGLILRGSGFTGKPVDLKHMGARWGVGAEILLWSGDGTHQGAHGRERLYEREGEAGEDNEDDDAQRVTNNMRWFTRAGFMRAKEYYDRLILQYPFIKTHPHALSAHDFYPAMFGLWISVAHEDSRRARADVAKEDDLVSFDETGGMAPTIDATYGDDWDRYEGDGGYIDSVQRQSETSAADTHAAAIIAARTAELADAEDIAAAMDSAMLSPPYSDSSHLLRLRGMVCQWVGDLRVSCVTADQSEDMLGKAKESAAFDLDYRRAVERREQCYRRADKFLRKAQERSRKGTKFRRAMED
ncbi:hypothetical protein KEM52_002157 [Ascosphaera acerosa]|nr:hypothetical protein KEM52_002157 [Ascosphaera acerosa]